MRSRPERRRAIALAALAVVGAAACSRAVPLAAPTPSPTPAASSPACDPRLLDVTFADRETSFALVERSDCSRGVRRSTDAGATWGEVSRAPSDVARIVAIDGAVVAFNPGLHRSVDAGATWSRTDRDAEVVWVASGDASWLVERDCDTACDLRASWSDDDGRTWATPASPTLMGLIDFIGLSATTKRRAWLAAVGRDGPTVLSAKDGSTWDEVAQPCALPRTMTAVGTDDVWIACEGALHRSSDGGRSWSRVTTPPGTATSLAFSAKRVGFMANAEGVHHTRDAGKRWERVAGVPGGVRVAVLDARVAWAVSGSSVYVTVDGGDTWTRYGFV